MTNTPKISIIIPVYNTEKYLHRCLDSVINQSLKEIEIICVENGSTDNSLKILEGYKEKDKRILLITLSEANLGKARNTGTNAASGDYLLFVDSDDFISLDCCEKLYSIAYKNNLDILQGLADTQFHWVFPYFKIVKKNFNRIMTGMDFWKDNLKFSVVVWDKLWKRDFFEKNSLFNPEGIFAEDVITTLKGVWIAKRFMAINYKFYFYRYNPDSITNRKLSEKYIQSYKIVTELIEEFMNKNKLESNSLIVNFHFIYAFIYYAYCCKDIEMLKEKIKKINKLHLRHFCLKYQLAYYFPSLATSFYPLWRVRSKLFMNRFQN